MGMCTVCTVQNYYAYGSYIPRKYTVQRVCVCVCVCVRERERETEGEGERDRGAFPTSTTHSDNGHHRSQNNVKLNYYLYTVYYI